jgi:chemotaxis protein MotA
VVANLICIPIADKLSLNSDKERLTKTIIVEGAIGINRGVSPMVLEESLKIFLSPKVRDKAADNKADAKAEAN